MKKKFFKEGAEPIISQEMLMEAFRSAFEKTQDRKNLDKVEEFFKDPKLFSVQCFLKDITKTIESETAAVLADKVGQGVAAHSKTLNSIYGPIFRCVENAIRNCLKENVIMASGADHQRIGDSVKILTKNQEKKATDIGEFDTCQKLWSRTVESKTMDWCGIPEEFTTTFMKIKTMRIFIVPNLLKMKVFDKKDSGSTETLWNNSLLRLAISAYIYEYDDLVYIIFVGDDDLIEAYNLVLNLVHCAQLELIGIKIKIDNSKVPTFCNFLITEHGRYVDLVNRAAKLQSKQFRKVEEIAAYQTSVADWLKSIRTQHDWSTSQKLQLISMA